MPWHDTCTRHTMQCNRRLQMPWHDTCTRRIMHSIGIGEHAHVARASTSKTGFVCVSVYVAGHC